MYKYESIAEQIRENIQSKTLLPNQQLPSLRAVSYTHLIREGEGCAGTRE